MTTYPAQIEERDGEFLVRFPDVPEAITGGSSLAEALILAPDALAAAAEGYAQQGRPFPSGRAAEPGEHAIPLNPAFAVTLAGVRTTAWPKVS